MIQPDEQELREKAQKEEAKIERLKRIFDGCQIFLSREVPREALTFVIRCFGGRVSWDAEGAPGSSFPESDTDITHQVVDRPVQSHRFLSR